MVGLFIMVVILVVFTAIVYVQPPIEQEERNQDNSTHGQSFLESIKSCAIFSFFAFVIFAFLLVGIMSTFDQCSSAANNDNGYDPGEYYD